MSYQRMTSDQFNEIIDKENIMLDQISMQVANIKHHSLKIGDTLDEDNQILDNITIQVDNNVTRVNKTTNRIQEMIYKVSGNKFIIIVIIMIIIISILLFILLR